MKKFNLILSGLILFSFSATTIAEAQLKSLANLKEGPLNIGLYQLRKQYQLRVSNSKDESLPQGTKVFLVDNPKRLVVDIPGFAASSPTSCLLYTSPSPRDATLSRMPSSA